jgi:hypothetical protein
MHAVSNTQQFLHVFLFAPLWFVLNGVVFGGVEMIGGGYFHYNRQYGRVRPQGMLGAGDKKSLLTSTTALRTVELCWAHSNRPVIRAGGSTGVARTVLVLPRLLPLWSDLLTSRVRNDYK